MSKRKLLLADDSITIQKVVNLTFADEGIEVVSVGDGDAAMLKFNEAMPDLVLADVNMPGLDGYRMCEMIKQDDETKHIPVILLVGSFEPFDEQEAWRVGADDFLTKPFQSIRQLVTKVSDLLNPSAKMTPEIAFEDESGAKTNELQLAETQEFSVPEIEDENLGDTGMDDEMIQTSQVGEPADEMQKFISDSYSYQSGESKDEFDHEDSTHNLVAESFQDEADGDFAILEPNQENFTDKDETDELEPIIDAQVYELSESETGQENNEIVAETAKMADDLQPSTAENLQFAKNSDWEIVSEDADENEVSPVAHNIEESEISENVEEISYSAPEVLTETREFDSGADGETNFVSLSEQATASEESDADNFEKQSEESKNEISIPMNSTVSFDDFDLLELPPLVEETGIRPLAETKAAKSEPEEIAQTTEIVAETEETVEPETSAQEISANSFPPELIEAIAQKVAERISDKTIREIAWEVVPQMTDLIVKRLAEEQLNKKAKEMSE